MEVEILPVTRYEQNCSIVWCERTRRAAVIDPGGDIDQILNCMEMLEVKPEVLLVTHGHFDHYGGVARIARETGARIEGPHRADAHLIAGLGTVGEGFGQPGAEPYLPERWLEHGDSVKFGDETLEVLHCPGHSRGHVAYVSRTARRAFVGDILFRHAIGAWEHSDGSLPDLIDSIRNRLFPLGDDVTFVPGHGPQSTFGHERIHNPFVGEEAQRRWRERRIPGEPDPAITR